MDLRLEAVEKDIRGDSRTRMYSTCSTMLDCVGSKYSVGSTPYSTLDSDFSLITQIPHGSTTVSDRWQVAPAFPF